MSMVEIMSFVICVMGFSIYIFSVLFKITHKRLTTIRSSIIRMMILIITGIAAIINKFWIMIFLIPLLLFLERFLLKIKIELKEYRKEEELKEKRARGDVIEVEWREVNEE